MKQVREQVKEPLIFIRQVRGPLKLLLRRKGLTFVVKEYEPLRKYKTVTEVRAYKGTAKMGYSEVRAYKGTAKTGYSKVGYLRIFFSPTKNGLIAQRSYSYVSPRFRGKRYGSLLSEVVNDYLLGQFVVKPPYKPTSITTSTVTSKRAAKRLMDLGMFPVGREPDSVFYSSVRTKTFKKIPEESLKEEYAANVPLLLERRAAREWIRKARRAVRRG